MLGDKVKTLLEEAIRYGRYEKERELLSHVQKTTKEILETDDEIRELIKKRIMEVLIEVFTPKIKEQQ